MKITRIALVLGCLLALSACPSEETTQEQSSTTTTETTTEHTSTDATAGHQHDDQETPPSGVATATEAEVKSEANALPAGHAENGAQVFIARGCTACHAISSLPEAKGAIGPALDGIAERAATRVEGLDAMAYLKQSIEEPEAYLVEGYANMMVKGLNEQMSPQEYADLLAYLMSLKG